MIPVESFDQFMLAQVGVMLASAAIAYYEIFKKEKGFGRLFYNLGHGARMFFWIGAADIFLGGAPTVVDLLEKGTTAAHAEANTLMIVGVLALYFNLKLADYSMIYGKKAERYWLKNYDPRNQPHAPDL
jgi:hypothetical protein